MSINVNLLEELDNLSKIHNLEREDIDAMMAEFAKRILLALRIDRMNVWLFGEDQQQLVSIGEYDLRSHCFKKDSVLLRKDFPVYFKALEENKIILAKNIHIHPATKELSEIYARPNDVISLMDIPLRMEGVMIGVMCFEKTGDTEKEFSPSDQFFALSVSQVFASNMEARHRRAVQHLLDKALQEKELLIQEMNHRVKNNFGILISLIRLSKQAGKTKDPLVLLDEYEHRIMSMLRMHDLLSQSQYINKVDLSSYLKKLAEEFKVSAENTMASVKFVSNNEVAMVNSGMALHIGLITTEIFLNSLKHGLPKQQHFVFEIVMDVQPSSIYIKAGDDLKDFDYSKANRNGSLGLQLIADIASDLGAKMITPSGEDSFYHFELPQ